LQTAIAALAPYGKRKSVALRIILATLTMRHAALSLELTALAATALLVVGARAAPTASTPWATTSASVSVSPPSIVQRFAGKLSALETPLFADAADGQLDHFSLLDAALVASGEDREEMLDHYGARLTTLLNELRPSVALRESPERRAERVFDFLHQRVLAGGYCLDCTDVRLALDEGRFNCVSAAVLFSCLADGVGLHTCGLETPGHAMNRVFLPDGTLDVETTCPRWFQLLHDPAKQAEAVSKTLGTAKRDHSTLREVTSVQLTAMIYYNRGVDLLAEKRFAEAAAVNAKALRLDPQNATARGNFLATLNNWSVDLGAIREYDAAVELLRAGMVFDRRYPAFQQNFAYLHHEWSESLCAAGRYAEAADLLRAATAEMPAREDLKKSLLEIYRRWPQSKSE
jgi:tetratricopeptide (TPR) repeat protein